MDADDRATLIRVHNLAVRAMLHAAAAPGRSARVPASPPRRAAPPAAAVPAPADPRYPHLTAEDIATFPGCTPGLLEALDRMVSHLRPAAEAAKLDPFGRPSAPGARGSGVGAAKLPPPHPPFNDPGDFAV